jgi:hypothetical protein
MLLGSHAVLYNRAKKRVTCRCTETIIPNFPIHPILVAKKVVNAQMFKWKNAAKFK